MIADWPLWVAAALSFLWFGIHLILGGREVAAPLRKTPDLPDLVKAVAWMCWHFVSVALALLAVFFAAAAMFDLPGLIWAGLALSVGFSIVGIGAAPLFGVSYSQMPQGFLFVPIAVLAVVAL